MRVNLVKSFLGLLAVTITEASYTYPHATIKLDVSGKAYELR